MTTIPAAASSKNVSTQATKQAACLMTGPYTLERRDQECGSICYEIWDSRQDSYRRLCVIDEEYSLTRGQARRDAAQIVRALNLTSLRVTEAAPDMLAQLQIAVRHMEHMAAWIAKQQGGYSFESLGEDMPDIRAALTKATGAA